jgi:predicted transposase YbfD/YdcC
MQVKENQKTLLGNLQNLDKYHKPYELYIQQDEKWIRNRLESRKLELFIPIHTERLGIIEDDFWRSKIQRIVKVTRTIQKKKNNAITQTTETAWYITNLQTSAKLIAEIIRAHWSIENSNHYVRDVTLQEDKSRIRKNASAFARLRSIGLNILRSKETKNRSKSIAETIAKNGWGNSVFRDYKELFTLG